MVHPGVLRAVSAFQMAAGGAPAVDMERCLEVALQAAEAAGEQIKAAWDKPRQIQHKGTAEPGD